MIENTGTLNPVQEVKITTANRIYPPLVVFVVAWHPWQVVDEYEDRVRIWGIYTDEAESKRVYDGLLKAETPLTADNKRGAFCWQRCENFNQGPDEDEREMEFGIKGKS